MMIRINLLPVRKKVQQEAGRQILALFAVVLIAANLHDSKTFEELADAVRPTEPRSRKKPRFRRPGPGGYTL